MPVCTIISAKKPHTRRLGVMGYDVGISVLSGSVSKVEVDEIVSNKYYPIASSELQGKYVHIILELIHMKVVILIKLLISLIIGWSHIFLDFAKLHFISAEEKHLEILALRSQLSVQQQEIINRKLPKPRFTQIQRQFWVLLSKIFPQMEGLPCA